MGLFTLGADIAMIPMGERVGAQLTKSRNLTLFGIDFTIIWYDDYNCRTRFTSFSNTSSIYS